MLISYKIVTVVFNLQIVLTPIVMQAGVPKREKGPSKKDVLVLLGYYRSQHNSILKRHLTPAI